MSGNIWFRAKTFKIKNRLILGSIIGIFVAFIGGVLNAIEYKSGLIDLKYTQISAALFLPENKINSFPSELIGSMIRYIVVIMISTSISCLLTFTGRKNATAKSIGFITTTWFIAVELIPKYMLNIRIEKPLYHYLTYADHLLSAILIAKLILKFGDSSLFLEAPKDNHNLKC